MIGTLESIVIDCPDAKALADFYGEILGLRQFPGVDDWIDLVGPGGAKPIIALQQVENYRAPEWPGQLVPQQLHLDIRVVDLDEGEAAVLALGATRTGSEEATFRVYLDPAGHPFCLINGTD